MDIRRIREAITEYVPKSATLVHGAARGADSLCAAVATKQGIQREAHPADWESLGKAAGAIRNQEMVDSGLDLLLAFPGGMGTADMVTRSKKAKIKVIYIV
jgi:predicted Rossmann-fold nucleotide-binding protein